LCFTRTFPAMREKYYRSTHSYHYERYFWSRKSAMKILFADRRYADAVGIATRHAAHQKDSLCSSSRATDTKHRVQMRMVESLDQRFLLQSCWVVRVISPRITSACHYRSRLAARHSAKCLFFGGGRALPTGEVKPISQRFGCTTHSRCVAWYDFRRQPAQRTKRNNAQSRDQLGPMQSRSVTSDATRMCDWSTDFIGISVTSNFLNKKRIKIRKSVHERNCYTKKCYFNISTRGRYFVIISCFNLLLIFYSAKNTNYSIQK